MLEAVRDDLWREGRAMSDAAAADRVRDEDLDRAVEAMRQQLALLLREEAAERAYEAADYPWEWAERVWLLLGLVVTAWLGRGGLVRACRRLVGWRQRGPTPAVVGGALALLDVGVPPLAPAVGDIEAAALP